MRRSEPDPVNVAGLIYRICSRWRVLLGAVIALGIVVGIIVVGVRLMGPARVEVGPIGVEGVP